MTMEAKRTLIEGNPVLVLVDIQGGESKDGEPSAIPFMPDYDKRMEGVPSLIQAARQHGVPVVFFQEVHRRNLIDFGRELDGEEGIHLLEGNPGTEIHPSLGLLPDDYVITKRRYSCFYGTEFEILLRALKADTLILVGGHTDVCVHYTFADAHQRDFFCRVVEDCVAGSSTEAHLASLKAMEYLQTGAVCSSDEVLGAFQSL